MSPRNFIRYSLILLLLLAASKGFSQTTAPNRAWNYVLLEGSELTDDCLICGRPTTLRDGWPDDAPVWPWALHTAPLHTRCNACGIVMGTSHTAMALCLPEGRQFWQEHPKIHFHSVARIEAEGCAALVSSFVSLSGSARLDVVSNLDTCAIIRAHISP